MRLKAGAVVLLLLAPTLAQSAGAQSYPITIQYGRSWPLSIVVDSSRGLAYFDATSGIYPPEGVSVGIVNVTSHSVAHVLPLNSTPGPVVLDQGSGNVYIAGSQSIGVLGGTNRTSIRMIKVGYPILYLAFDNGVSADAFFTSGARVFAFDPGTGAIVANATVGGGAGGMATDPASGRLYVADYLSATIVVLQASTLAQVGTIRLPSCCPSQLALDQKTQTLYASTGTNRVDVVDAKSDTFVRSVQVAPSSQNSTSAVVVDDRTGMVFVASSPGGSIVELEGPSGNVVGVLRVNSAVAGLALDPATRELYATNYHQVTVFDLRGTGQTPNYTEAAVAAVGALVAAVALLVVIRSPAWRNRSARPAG